MDKSSDILGIRQETPSLENLIARLEAIHTQFPLPDIRQVIDATRSTAGTYIMEDEQDVLREWLGLAITELVVPLEQAAEKATSAEDLQNKMSRLVEDLILRQEAQDAMLHEIQKATGNPKAQFADLT